MFYLTTLTFLDPHLNTAQLQMDWSALTKWWLLQEHQTLIPKMDLPGQHLKNWLNSGLNNDNVMLLMVKMGRSDIKMLPWKKSKLPQLTLNNNNKKKNQRQKQKAELKHICLHMWKEVNDRFNPVKNRFWISYFESGQTSFFLEYAVYTVPVLQLRWSQWSSGSARWEPQEKVKEFGKRILMHM